MYSILFIALGVVAVAALCISYGVFALLTNRGNEVEAAADPVSPAIYAADGMQKTSESEQMDKIPDFEVYSDELVDKFVKDGQMTLPDSSIVIGIPAFTQAYGSMEGESYYFSFYVDDNFLVTLESKKTEYPFTKSEEIEYFNGETNYSRIEGSEQQFFYTQSNGDQPQATIVDLTSKNTYYITVKPVTDSASSTDQELENRKAFKILNEDILDSSNIVQPQS